MICGQLPFVTAPTKLTATGVGPLPQSSLAVTAGIVSPAQLVMLRGELNVSEQLQAVGVASPEAEKENVGGVPAPGSWLVKLQTPGVASKPFPEIVPVPPATSPAGLTVWLIIA